MIVGLLISLFVIVQKVDDVVASQAEVNAVKESVIKIEANQEQFKRDIPIIQKDIEYIKRDIGLILEKLN